MVWAFLCSKIALLSLSIPESNRACTSEVLFFPQIKVHNNNQLYKSLAGDQLWNSGRQD